MKPVYLFLDIDGVLNNHKTTEREGCYIGVDKSLLSLFSTMFGRVSCEIRVVLSSTWRKKPADFEHIRSQLATHNIPLFGKTDYTYHRPRREEISDYLFVNDIADEKVIIVDDDMDAETGGYNSRFFRTDERFGITQEIVDSIVAFINE